MSDETYHTACATCHTAASFRGDCARMPEGCPTRARPEVTRDPRPYLEPARAALMRVADASPYTPEGERRSRVEELLFFVKERGLTRVGVAFCVSMTKEAQRLAERLEAEGVTAELACCRLGAIDYDEVGLTRAHPDRFASACNPVAQARLLDDQGVQLIVQMGLCLGHDLILQEAAKAPVTTLVVKDRALDHNPILALRRTP